MSLIDGRGVGASGHLEPGPDVMLLTREDFQLWTVTEDYQPFWLEVFEEGWVVPGEYLLVGAEAFEDGWLVPGDYLLVGAEVFEYGWSVETDFAEASLTDGFEVGWFTDSPPDLPCLVETFEDGGW